MFYRTTQTQRHARTHTRVCDAESGAKFEAAHCCSPIKSGVGKFSVDLIGRISLWGNRLGGNLSVISYDVGENEERASGLGPRI